MWRQATRILVALLLLLALAISSGAAYQWIATRHDLAANPPPGRLVDVGGHTLHIWCTGAGRPTIVFESGLGGSSFDWGFIQPKVAQFAQACSYDRAGMGYSDPGSPPRTARRIAGELAELLDRSRVAGPVVLVGASSGGYVVRVFASDYASRAAGLVLVDASHEDQILDVPAIAPFVPLLSRIGALRLLGISFGLPPDSLAPEVRRFAHATRFRAAGNEAGADEIRNMGQSVADVKATRRELTIPVVVVTGARGADAEWWGLQRDQLRLSDRSCQIVASQSGHVVPIDQPEIIVNAIRAIIEAARTGTAADCDTV